MRRRRFILRTVAAAEVGSIPPQTAPSATAWSPSLSQGTGRGVSRPAVAGAPGSSLLHSIANESGAQALVTEDGTESLAGDHSLFQEEWRTG